MFCGKCGKEIMEGTSFCPGCGTAVNAPVQPTQPAFEQPIQPAFEQPVQPAQPAFEQPAQPAFEQPVQPAQPAFQQTAQSAPQGTVENPEAKGAMIMGIVAACICWIPFASIAGIILGILALKRSSLALQYADQGYGQRPMGIVAKVLGICSIAFGGFYSFYWLFFFIGFIAGLLG